MSAVPLTLGRVDGRRGKELAVGHFLGTGHHSSSWNKIQPEGQSSADHYLIRQFTLAIGPAGI